MGREGLWRCRNALQGGQRSLQHAGPVNGCPPCGCASSSQAQLVNQIKAARYEFDPEGWGSISDSAKDLISKILVRASALRAVPCSPRALCEPWRAVFPRCRL